MYLLPTIHPLPHCQIRPCVLPIFQSPNRWKAKGGGEKTSPSKRSRIKIQTFTYSNLPIHCTLSCSSLWNHCYPRPPSHQPNIGVTCASLPIASSINTLLTIRCSSILSVRRNHLNSLWSTDSPVILALLHCFSFINLSICVTPAKLRKHFI